METVNAIRGDTVCCRMKSVGGYCPKPLESVSEVLSKKWTISIVVTVGNFRKLRFNDLRGRLGGVSAKTLVDRLRELMKEGVVERRVFRSIPPKVEYALTEKGGKLMEALLPLMHWSEHMRDKAKLAGED